MFRHTRSAGIMPVLCSCDEDGCCTCCSVCLYSYMCSRQPPKTHFGSYLNTVCRFSHLHESVCAWYPWSSPACFPLAPSLAGLGVGRAQYMYGTWDDITPPYLRAALFLKLKRRFFRLSLMLIFFWHTAEGKNNKNNKVYASFFCGICNSFSTLKYTDVKKISCNLGLELLC